MQYKEYKEYSKIIISEICTEIRQQGYGHRKLEKPIKEYHRTRKKKHNKGKNVRETHDVKRKEWRDTKTASRSEHEAKFSKNECKLHKITDAQKESDKTTHCGTEGVQ